MMAAPTILEELGTRQQPASVQISNGRKDLEAVKAAGEMLRIKVLGLASIAPDVSPALPLATIESITVLGVLHASE